MSKRNRLKESDDSLPCPTASSLRPFSRPELGTYPQGDLSSSPGAKDENAVVGGKATDVVADEASLDVVEVLNVDIFLEILQYRSLSLCLGLTAPDGLLIAICWSGGQFHDVGLTCVLAHWHLFPSVILALFLRMPSHNSPICAPSPCSLNPRKTQMRWINFKTNISPPSRVSGLSTAIRCWVTMLSRVSPTSPLSGYLEAVQSLTKAFGCLAIWHVFPLAQIL